MASYIPNLLHEMKLKLSFNFDDVTESTLVRELCSKPLVEPLPIARRARVCPHDGNSPESPSSLCLRASSQTALLLPFCWYILRSAWSVRAPGLHDAIFRAVKKREDPRRSSSLSCRPAEEKKLREHDTPHTGKYPSHILLSRGFRSGGSCQSSYSRNRLRQKWPHPGNSIPVPALSGRTVNIVSFGRSKFAFREKNPESWSVSVFVFALSRSVKLVYEK